MRVSEHIGSTALASSPTRPPDSAATALAAELSWVDASVRRAAETTAAFEADIGDLPFFEYPPPAKSKARETFEHFDVDGSGCLAFDEVFQGLRAMGLKMDADDARDIFDRADANGSGNITTDEFAGIVEGVANVRQGRAADGARLLQAASTLLAQALAEPLVLVAEGEVPTLLKCASSGHAAVELLGLSALASVAEAPQPDCAAAIVARGPALSRVLARLNRADCAEASVRQGVRLLSALCREADEARAVDARRRLRLKLYDFAAPLLHGPFGAACTRCAESDLHTAQCLGHTLQALAAEPTLVPRLTADGGGGALALACGLAAACHDTHTQYALVETIGACADEPTFGWRLVGFGALQPLLRAAAVPPAPAEPPIAEVARRALRALKYDELWRGAACDPLDEAVVREALTAARAAKGSPGKPGTGRA